MKKFNIKAFVVAFFAAAVFVLAGCDKLPSADKIENVSKTRGQAAGLTGDLAKMSDKARTTTLEVMDIVDDVVPSVNQTFTDAWAPVIEETITKSVTEGKITSDEGAIVKTAMGAVTQGLDYVFEVRWPTAKDYKELVSAAVRGFTEGFKTVIKPTNMKAAADFDYDEAEFKKAQEWFRANPRK